MFFHQSRNPLQTAAFSCFSKVHENPWSTIHAGAALIRSNDLCQQSLVINGSVRQWFLQPLIKTAAGYLQYSTHRHDVVFMSMIT
jgi:hypothetical protein